jgi:ADP-ribose pyrophosphatase
VLNNYKRRKAEMASVEKVTQITHNRFLNYYELSTVNRTGGRGTYYMASRAKDVSGLDLTTGGNRPDGVVIFSLAGEKKDHVVLVRQFRYPIADYVYELPAGLIENGENHREAAIREMKEETGLEFRPLDVDPMYERPFYNSVGMTDESCNLVYGYCEGTVSREGLEETEELDVVLADREEAVRILSSEKVAANCAYMLMQFIARPEDAFSFLRK